MITRNSVAGRKRCLGRPAGQRANRCSFRVIDDVVLDVDVASKTVKVHLMEGLI